MAKACLGLCSLAKNLWSRTETRGGMEVRRPACVDCLLLGWQRLETAEAGGSRVLLWLFALRAVKVKSSAPPPCFTVRAA